MKKLLIAASVAFIALSSQAFAAGEKDDAKAKEVGEAIFKKALGTGCYGCHAASSNPQIIDTAKSGTLTREHFEKVLRDGQKSMPPALGHIMEMKQVISSGYSEEQAIDAIYNYLKKHAKK